MNKISRITTILILTLIFTSCEKEEFADYKSESTTTEEKVVTKSNKVGNGYWAFECLVQLPDGQQGPLNKGSSCQVAAVSSCTGFSNCAAMSPTQVSTFFSALEIEDWDNGEFEFGQNAEFINNHRDFYMYLFTERNGIHPDEIIAINDF